jgi:hypothetical protein
MEATGWENVESGNDIAIIDEKIKDLYFAPEQWRYQDIAEKLGLSLSYVGKRVVWMKRHDGLPGRLNKQGRPLCHRTGKFGGAQFGHIRGVGSK